MCGRYTLYVDIKTVAGQFGVPATLETSPRYNIAPTQDGHMSEPGEAIDDEVENSEDEHKHIEQEHRETTTIAEIVPPQRSLASYLIAVVLLGLAPTLVGFMFAAAFDYIQQGNLFFPGR